MYPEVKKFKAALEAANNERRKAPISWAHDPKTCGECIFEAALSAALHALRASSDPLVAWIAANCVNYVDEAAQVLIALPASMDDLDTMARDMGWCGVWQQFREEAEEAGVLPAEPEATS